MKEALKLQVSLSTVKLACESSEVKAESWKIIQPVIDHSISEICSVFWAERSAKYVAITRNEGLWQENGALLKKVNELQKKSKNDCVYKTGIILCIPI